MAARDSTRSESFGISEIIDAALAAQGSRRTPRYPFVPDVPADIAVRGAKGLGMGLLDVLQGVPGMLRHSPFAPTAVTEGIVAGAEQRGAGAAPPVGAPVVTPGRPANVEQAYGQPSMGFDIANTALLGLPGMGRQLIQSPQPRFLSEGVPGPLAPGQPRPISTRELYRPSPGDIAQDVGQVAGQAAPFYAGPLAKAVGARMAPAATDAGFMRGRPGVPTDVFDLNMPVRQPGPRGGGARGGPVIPSEQPGTYRLTVRMPNGKTMQVDTDAASAADALHKFYATVPPDILQFVRRQNIQAMRFGEMSGIPGFRPSTGAAPPPQPPPTGRQGAPRPEPTPEATPSPPAPAGAPEAPPAARARLAGEMTAPGFSAGDAPAKPGTYRVMAKFKGEKKFSQHRDVEAANPREALQKVQDELPVGFRGAMEFDAKFVAGAKKGASPVVEKPAGPPPGKTPTLAPARSVKEAYAPGYKPGLAPAVTPRAAASPPKVAPEPEAPSVQAPETPTPKAGGRNRPEAPATVQRQFTTRKAPTKTAPPEPEPAEGVAEVLRAAETAKRGEPLPPKGPAKKAEKLPGWLRSEMAARGSRVGRLMNEIDAAQSKALLDSDPLISEIAKTDPELAKRASTGNVTREELAPFLSKKAGPGNPPTVKRGSGTSSSGAKAPPEPESEPTPDPEDVRNYRAEKSPTGAWLVRGGPRDAVIRSVGTKKLALEIVERTNREGREGISGSFMHGRRPEAPAPKAGAAAEAARASSNLGTAVGEAGRGGIERLARAENLPGHGRAAKLLTPARDYAIRYVEVPLDDVIASHRPENFEPHPDYPLEQQRDYSKEKAEQAKVIAYARDYKPEFLLADLPTSTDGPPVTFEDSGRDFILGGNGRTMALQRAIADGSFSEEQLAAAIDDARAKYGIRDRLETDRPTIIVRRVTEKLTLEEQRRATKNLNEPFQQAVGQASDAISRAKNLSHESLKYMSDALAAEPEKSVRDLLNGDSEFYKNVLRRLSEDEVIGAPEFPRYMDERTGRLNETGQRLVEDVFLGRVVKNPNLIRTMKPAPRQLFTSALSELVRAEAAPPQYVITPDIVNGLALYEMAEKSGLSIEDQLEQGTLISEQGAFLDAMKDNKPALAMAHWIEENVNRPTSLRKALAEYNTYVADAAGDQGTLGFVERLDPHEAFNRAFGVKLTPEEFGSGDGTVLLYAGLPWDAIKKAVLPRLSKRAKAFWDWLSIPTDVKPGKPGETLQQRFERTLFPKTGDSFRRHVGGAVMRFLSVAMQNRKTRHFPYFHEQMDQWSVDRQNASVAVLEKFSEMMDPISHTTINGRRVKRPAKAAREHFKKLNWLIYIHNEWVRAENGITTPHHAEPWAKGLTRDQVAAGLKEMAAEARAGAPSEVTEAWKRGIRVMKEMRQELEARGKLSPLDRFGDYYWPNVFDDYSWTQSMYLYPKSPLRIKEAGRMYVKQALGTIRQHQPNALLSGIRHVLNATLDNLLDDFAESVAKTWDVTEDIVKQAKAQGVPLENIRIPAPGYRLYTVKRGSYGWRPLSIEEFKIAEALRNDPDLPPDIQTMADLVADPRGRYLIRAEIAGQLDHFRAPRGELEAFGGDISGAVRWWKSWLLSSLGSYFQLTNMMGDTVNVLRLPGIEKVSIGGVKVPIPAGVAAFQHLPDAIKDSIQQTFGDPTHPDVFRRHGKIAKPLLEMLGGRDPSPTALRALQLGVTQQTYAVAELWDLRKHDGLDVFFRPNRGSVVGTAARAFDVMDKAFTWQTLATQMRESVPRQMVWLHLMSKHIRAKRAERISGELLVDYRNADAITQFLRTFAVAPFITFYRQMLPGWSRSVFGQRFGRMSEAPGGGGIAPPNEPPPPAGGDPVDWPFQELSPEEAAKGLPKEMQDLPFSGEPIRGGLKWFAMTFGVPMFAVWYWNSVLHKELDEQVDEWTKLNMTYLIVGETKDGRPIMVSFTSPADLFFGNVGLSNPVGRAERLLKGFEAGEGGRAVGRQAFETAVGPVSTAAGLLGPWFSYAAAADDISRQNWKQMQLEDPELDKKIDQMFSKLVKEQTPYVRQMRAITRQDLGDEPAWFPLIISPSPFSLLIKVPYTDEELKRVYGKPSSGKVGAGVGGGAGGEGRASR